MCESTETTCFKFTTETISIHSDSGLSLKKVRESQKITFSTINQYHYKYVYFLDPNTLTILNLEEQKAIKYQLDTFFKPGFAVDNELSESPKCYLLTVNGELIYFANMKFTVAKTTNFKFMKLGNDGKVYLANENCIETLFNAQTLKIKRKFSNAIDFGIMNCHFYFLFQNSTLVFYDLKDVNKLTTFKLDIDLKNVRTKVINGSHLMVITEAKIYLFDPLINDRFSILKINNVKGVYGDDKFIYLIYSKNGLDLLGTYNYKLINIFGNRIIGNDENYNYFIDSSLRLFAFKEDYYQLILFINNRFLDIKDVLKDFNYDFNLDYQQNVSQYLEKHDINEDFLDAKNLNQFISFIQVPKKSFINKTIQQSYFSKYPFYNYINLIFQKCFIFSVLFEKYPLNPISIKYKSRINELVTIYLPIYNLIHLQIFNNIKLISENKDDYPFQKQVSYFIYNDNFYKDISFILEPIDFIKVSTLFEKHLSPIGYFYLCISYIKVYDFISFGCNFGKASWEHAEKSQIKSIINLLLDNQEIEICTAFINNLPNKMQLEYFEQLIKCYVYSNKSELAISILIKPLKNKELPLNYDKIFEDFINYSETNEQLLDKDFLVLLKQNNKSNLAKLILSKK